LPAKIEEDLIKRMIRALRKWSREHSGALVLAAYQNQPWKR
jgi:hypothetical protein